jgi:hypothetical protein
MTIGVIRKFLLLNQKVQLTEHLSMPAECDREKTGPTEHRRFPVREFIRQ